MSLTPHGPGFSFLDALEIITPGQQALGRKHFPASLPVFADHFPGNPLVPGVLLVECAAQAAGALWQQSEGYLASVQQFRFRQPVRPGQTVTMEVTLEKEMGQFAQFAAVLRVGEDVVAEGKLVLSRRL